MRERLGNILRCFTAAVADAALSSLLIALMLALYDMPRTVELAVGTFTLVLFVQAVVNELLASRGVSMLIYIVVNTALLLTGRHYVLLNTVFIPGSSGFPILLGLLVLACGVHSAFAAQKLPGSDFFVRMTDVLIIGAALYLLSTFMLGEAFNAAILVFVLAAFALLLLTTASLRAGGESDSVIRGTGIGGWLVLVALFAFCLLFTAALLSLSDGHIDSLVTAILAVWGLVYRASQILLTLFVRFLALFIRPRHMKTQMAAQESFALGGEEIAEIAAAPDWVATLIMAIMGLLVLVAIGALLWALHHTKFSRVRRQRRRRRITRKSHFFSALYALLCRIKERIAFELACLFYKKTPQGLLILAQRTGALHRLPRRKSESGGAYLRRLHGVLLERQAPSSLDELAAMLDALFYGGASVALTAEQYQTYSAQIRQLFALSAGEKTKPRT